MDIFKKCIEEGNLPTNWKEAAVTPVFKKVDKSQIENYRPVSYLTAAAKLLETIVSQQASSFMERNNFLSKNQYGF
jgi:hypothetical protein